MLPPSNRGIGGMADNLNAYSASYRQWAQAQDKVSDLEKRIFDSAHRLTDAELSELRALRCAAAAHLSQLIGELDDEVARLHAFKDLAAAHRPAPP